MHTATPPPAPAPSASHAVQVRLATPADIGELAALFDQYRRFQGQAADLAAARGFLQARFEQGDAVLFLASAGGPPVGMAQLYPSHSSVAVSRVFILNDLFVAEAGRRLGVASALLAAVEAHAWAHGAVRLTLNVARTNQPGQALYRARGWQPDGQFFMFHRFPPASTPSAARAPGTAGAAGEAATPTVTLSPPAPGDIGWVISRHGTLYAQEYGWDWRFEAMVARICADFVERFDGEHEACWIARRAAAGARPATGDERLGCVFLVQARDDDSGAVIAGVAQLRMLIVEPAARGLGLGQRLVQTCEDFARAKGYRQMRLWTNHVLHAARHIYQSRGWQLVRSEAHESFGAAMVGEFWELDLRP